MQNTPPPGSLVSKVELFIECRDLKNLDLLSKSDPCVVVYAGHPRNAMPSSTAKGSKAGRAGMPGFQWKEVGRTEVVKDNLNPAFHRAFRLDYHFEEVQPLRFLVLDIDSPNDQDVSRHDHIGVIETTLGEIAGSAGQKLVKPLDKSAGGRKGTSRGCIVLRMQEVHDHVRDNVRFTLRGVKLAKKDLFSSDPYFVIKRAIDSGEYVTVYKSEVIKKNLNPKWKSVHLPLAKLSPTGNYEDRLLVEVWDWDKLSDDDIIGTATVTIAQLQQRVSISLINEKARSSGTVAVDQFDVQKVFSFLDFLSRGCEIGLMVAVDWTGSNGHPTDPRSLHFSDPNTMNQYEQVIRSVGNIIGYYDKDQLFPAFGFGGKLPNGQVSHCFALNGSPARPECQGVEGILHAYRQALSNVQLYGPTYFNEIIKSCNVMARESASSGRQQYLVLLIITDGVINDMQKTINAIVEGSELPLSIVIVGVGNADFSNMDTLDADEGGLRASSGRHASRDIVQFVPFRKYANFPYQELSREVLAEIPQQLTGYFASKGIQPLGL